MGVQLSLGPLCFLVKARAEPSGSAEAGAVVCGQRGRGISTKVVRLCAVVGGGPIEGRGDGRGCGQVQNVTDCCWRTEEGLAQNEAETKPPKDTSKTVQVGD